MQRMGVGKEYLHETWHEPLRWDSSNRRTHPRVGRIYMISLETPVMDEVTIVMEEDSMSIMCVCTPKHDVHIICALDTYHS